RSASEGKDGGRSGGGDRDHVDGARLIVEVGGEDELIEMEAVLAEREVDECAVVEHIADGDDLFETVPELAVDAQLIAGAGGGEGEVFAAYGELGRREVEAGEGADAAVDGRLRGGDT